MKKRTKIILISVAGLVILLFILKSAGVFGKTEGIKVTVEEVSKRNITEVITANGKVQPETEVKISSDVSGEIVELYVKEGDQVKVGDLLLKIRPDIYQSNLDRMLASLNSTRANLANSKARLAQTQAQFEQAQLSFKRNKKLYEEKAISQAEFEQANSAYLTAQAEVDAAEQTVKAAEFAIQSAEASLKESRENLNKTSIYAPMTGTVSKLNDEKGERVVGTSQMAGTELLRIADMNRMEVLIDVNENDIVRVSLNDTAIIEMDAYFGKKFKGTVTEIANSSTSTGLSVTSSDEVTNFQVKILIIKNSYKELIPKDNANFFPFRPGMTATVDIQTETRKNILSVPILSVTTRIDSTNIEMEEKPANEDEEMKVKNEKEKLIKKKTDEPEEVVFVYEKDGKITKTVVKTGIQDNDFIEIITGLKEKQQIVTGPYSAISKRLKDGQKVEKTEKDKLFEKE